jgi:SOS-response transcriptional repressor LexA
VADNQDRTRTDRQPTDDIHWHLDRRVLAFIADFWGAFGYAPTVREVQAGCAAKSLRTTQSSLDRLENVGYLARESGKGRSLRLTRAGAEAGLTKVVLGQLYFHHILGKRLYPYFCTAAGMAPTRKSAEGWLLFVLGQVRQNDAIELACARAQVTTPLPATVIRDVEAIWTQVAEHVAGITTWINWLTQEEFWTAEILGEIPEPGHLDAQTDSSLVLEGNLETAHESQRFIIEEVDRLRALAADPALFELELAAGRRRAAETYSGVDDLRVRVLSS